MVAGSNLSKNAQSSWSEFGHLLVDRFGKEQHELAILQLFSYLPNWN
jgi:hypothetical protein